jgi:hypothetical protein
MGGLPNLVPVVKHVARGAGLGTLPVEGPPEMLIRAARDDYQGALSLGRNASTEFGDPACPVAWEA